MRALREANVARQKVWDTEGKITPLYRAVELSGEVGEALNIVKKLERERLGIRGSRAAIGDLADELADIVICVDLLAESYGIDLSGAVVAKFNKTSEKYGLPVKMEPSAL